MLGHALPTHFYAFRKLTPEGDAGDKERRSITGNKKLKFPRTGGVRGVRHAGPVAGPTGPSLIPHISTAPLHDLLPLHPSTYPFLRSRRPPARPCVSRSTPTPPTNTGPVPRMRLGPVTGAHFPRTASRIPYGCLVGFL